MFYSKRVIMLWVSKIFNILYLLIFRIIISLYFLAILNHQKISLPINSYLINYFSLCGISGIFSKQLIHLAIFQWAMIVIGIPVLWIHQFIHINLKIIFIIDYCITILLNLIYLWNERLKKQQQLRDRPLLMNLS